MRLRFLAGTVLSASLLLLTGCSSSGSTTASGSATPPASDAAASSASTGHQAQHDGGTLTLLAKSAGGTLDPQVNYTAAVLAALPGHVRRPGRLQEGERRRRRSPSSPTSPRRSRRRRTAARPTSSRSARGSSSRTARTSPTDDVVASFQRIFKVQQPDGRLVLQRHRRRGRLPQDAGDLHARRGRASVTTRPGHRDDQPHGRRPRVPVQARRAARRRSSRRARPTKDAGTKPIPATGRVLCSSPTTRTTPSSWCATRTSRSGRRTRSRRATRTRSTRSSGSTVEAAVTAVENGQADWIFDAPAGRPARRDRHEVRRPGARQPADGVLVPAAERQPRAVQQPQGAPGGQLGDRPQRRSSSSTAAPTWPHRSCTDPAAGLPRATRTTARTRSPGSRRGRRPTSRRPSSSSGVGHRGPDGRRSSRRTTRSTRRSASTSQSAAHLDRLQGDRQADLGEHPVHVHPEHEEQGPDRATRSGTRTTRPRRTSSTCCSGCASFVPAATRSINIAGLLRQGRPGARWTRRWRSAPPTRTAANKHLGPGRPGRS